MPSDANSALPTLVSYRPSAFYFRRDLRAAKDRREVFLVVETLVAETAQIEEFGRRHGIEFAERQPRPRRVLGLESLRRIGLDMCRELEEVKARVRARGLIPPKCHIMGSEADEKGWEVG